MNKPTFLLTRFSDDTQSTLGLLYELKPEVNPFLWAFTLEDEHRDKKEKGNTRIPSGTYKLGIREQVTPLTKKYRDDKRLKGIFEFHIEILNVPDFSGIYIHLGNKESHTDGCILVGDRPLNNQFGDGEIIDSVNTYIRFYNYLYPKLKAKEEHWIKIIDEKDLFKNLI